MAHIDHTSFNIQGAVTACFTRLYLSNRQCPTNVSLTPYFPSQKEGNIQSSGSSSTSAITPVLQPQVTTTTTPHSNAGIQGLRETNARDTVVRVSGSMRWDFRFTLQPEVQHVWDLCGLLALEMHASAGRETPHSRSDVGFVYEELYGWKVNSRQGLYSYSNIRPSEEIEIHVAFISFGP